MNYQINILFKSKDKFVHSSAVLPAPVPKTTFLVDLKRIKCYLIVRLFPTTGPVSSRFRSVKPPESGSPGFVSIIIVSFQKI